MGSRSQVIDPPRSTQDDGGGGGWTWLTTARGIIEAQLICGVLEEAGIAPVWLDTRDPSPTAWMFMSGNPNAPVPIYVPASHLDTARLALLDSGLGDAVEAGDEVWDAEADESDDRGSFDRAPWGRAGVVLAGLVVLILLLASVRAAVTS